MTRPWRRGLLSLAVAACTVVWWSSPAAACSQPLVGPELADVADGDALLQVHDDQTIEIVGVREQMLIGHTPRIPFLPVEQRAWRTTRLWGDLVETAPEASDTAILPGPLFRPFWLLTLCSWPAKPDRADTRVQVWGIDSTTGANVTVLLHGYGDDVHGYGQGLQPRDAAALDGLLGPPAGDAPSSVVVGVTGLWLLWPVMVAQGLLALGTRDLMRWRHRRRMRRQTVPH